MNELLPTLARLKSQRILLTAAAVLVYGISLLNGFVWDDRIYFIGNPVYRNFDLAGIFTSLANGVEYLPLRDITYAFDYLVWGENPFGFHLTNLLFFVLNSLLAFELLILMSARISAVSGRVWSWFTPLCVALLFALHPINAEVVNFVTCRNVLVSGVFFFSSIICLLRHFSAPSTPVYLLSLALFACAVLGKATALMLPVLLLLILPVLYPGALKRTMLLLTPFFGVAAMFFLIFRQIADKAGFTDTSSYEITLFNLERKIVLAAQIPFFYLQKLLLPFGFSVAYETSFVPNLLSLQLFAAITAILAAFFFALIVRRRNPGLAVGLFWYFAALLPVLNIFGTYPVVADRYAYLPAFGFMLIVGTFLESCPGSRIKLAILILIAVLLAGLSIRRSRDWTSNETLWSANIRNYPNNTKSYVNLANHYFHNGQQQKALDLLSNNSHVPNLKTYYYFYKGKSLYEMNRLAEAKSELLYVVNSVESGFIAPMYFLGLIYEKEGDYMSACYYYNKALASTQKDDFFVLPAVRTRLQSLQKVWLDGYLAAMRGGVAKDKGDLSLRRDLAMTLDRLGFYKEALEQYSALERAGVKGWQLFQNIANCHFNSNNDKDAVRFYEKVIAAGGGSEDTYNNLGISYRRMEKYAESLRVLEQAVALFPTAPFPAYNLAVTYHAAGMKERARKSFEALVKKFPDLKDRADAHLLMLVQ